MFLILKSGKQNHKYKIQAIWVERSGTGYLLLSVVSDIFVSHFLKVYGRTFGTIKYSLFPEKFPEK